VYIYDVEYLVQYIISYDVYVFYYVCGSIYFLKCRVCVCVHVVGRLEVYCREGKYGRLVNVEGWGILVSLEGGRVIFFVL
jgi:hypothetical protein